MRQGVVFLYGKICEKNSQFKKSKSIFFLNSANIHPIRKLDQDNGHISNTYQFSSSFINLSSATGHLNVRRLQ